MSPARSVLIVTFDRLPASILGCYGNEWIETQHIDRMAARGLVADQCWAAHIVPATAQELFCAASCVSALKDRGVFTHLFQESGSQVDFSAARFDTVNTLTGESGAEARPDRIPLAEIVRVAKHAWKDRSDRQFLWLHACGLSIPAAPPRGFAELYHDEFEDRGFRLETLSEAERPRHPAIAAGMASLLDHWVGEALSSIDPADSNNSLLTVVTAAQGANWQPLPNSFGPGDELRSQAAHVPLIIGAPEAVIEAGQRTASLLTTQDIGPLIEWWFQSTGESPPSLNDFLRDLSSRHGGRIVTSGTDGAKRVTTCEWAAIFPSVRNDAESKPVLFRKPEDYWEVNDVAALEPLVVEELRP